MNARPHNATIPTRPGYESIVLYTPGTAPCPVDVSDTLNLWGAPPAALDALRVAADAHTVSHYPSLYNADLKAPLAEYAGVRPEEIVTGAGSDDVLDCAIRAFAQPNGVLAHVAPTFAMVPVYARSNGLEPVPVPLTGDDYAVDADALLALDPCVIYLCSPNNPTGTPARRDAVRRVIERAPGLVIIDEAYAEFVLADPEARARGAEDYTRDAPGWERVLVMRTMSKAFGLASMRVGYGVAHERVVAEVEKARGPFKCALLAERAVRAALGADGLAWMREHAALAVQQRERLIAALRALGIDAPTSTSNFAFAPLPDAAGVARRLAERGVAVRVIRGAPTVAPALARSGGEGLRVGAASAPIQDAFLAALREVL